MRQPSRIDALDRQFEILGRVQVLEVNAGLLKLHRSLQVRSTCGCTGPAGCSLPVYATSRIVLFALSRVRNGWRTLGISDQRIGPALGPVSKR